LPYYYVTNGLAEDWRTLIEQEWIDTVQFGEWCIFSKYDKLSCFRFIW